MDCRVHVGNICVGNRISLEQSPLGSSIFTYAFIWEIFLSTCIRVLFDVVPKSPQRKAVTRKISLCAILATCSTWRRDTKHWPKTYSPGCGHKNFNGNVGLRHFLTCKVAVAPLLLTLFWANCYSNMTELERNWLEPINKYWPLKRWNKYYKQRQEAWSVNPGSYWIHSTVSLG